MPAERIEVPVALAVAFERAQRATIAPRWRHFLLSDSDTLYGTVSADDVRLSHRSSLAEGEHPTLEVRGRFVAVDDACALVGRFSTCATEGDVAHFSSSLRRALNRP